jgi:integrase/recombinase XerD
MANKTDSTRAINDYLNYAAIEKGLSKNTISAYRRDLEKFTLYLDRINQGLENVDHQLMNGFLGWLRGSGGDKPSSESSNARVIVTVRNLFKFISINNRTPNPLQEYAPPKIPKRLPKALKLEEIVMLLEASKLGDQGLAIRDNALIEILYATGARISEIVELEVSDISEISENLTIKLVGKGNKERVVPIGNYARSSLDKYLVSSRPKLLKNKKSNKVFLNSRGNRLSRQSAWEIVDTCAKRAQLESQVSPHSIRHSFATHLLDGGADIRVVQELLGHSSVTTTQIYTLVTIDKLRESYASSHPRAKRTV